MVRPATPADAEDGRSWIERFEAALRRAEVADVEVGPLSARWARAFGAAYRDRYDADEAAVDLREMDRLNATGQVGAGEPVAVRAFRNLDDSPLQFRFKLYRRGPSVPLSDVLPIMTVRSLGQGDPSTIMSGVIQLVQNQLQILRMAPKRQFNHLPFDVWMSLAKATPLRRSEAEPHQGVH